MEEERKYHWRDPDVVLLLDREYLEEDAAGQERELVDGDGKMDDDTFDMLSEEIRDELFVFLHDCYTAVEERIAREKRNEGAEKSDSHYRVYWKNENAYRPDYGLIGTYTNLDDARDYIREQFKTEYDFYKIVGVKDGVEDGKDYATSEHSTFELVPNF